jgi:hypothetical protein
MAVLKLYKAVNKLATKSTAFEGKFERRKNNTLDITLSVVRDKEAVRLLSNHFIGAAKAAFDKVLGIKGTVHLVCSESHMLLTICDEKNTQLYKTNVGTQAPHTSVA